MFLYRFESQRIVVLKSFLEVVNGNIINLRIYLPMVLSFAYFVSMALFDSVKGQCNWLTKCLPIVSEKRLVSPKVRKNGEGLPAG